MLRLAWCSGGATYTLHWGAAVVLLPCWCTGDRRLQSIYVVYKSSMVQSGLFESGVLMVSGRGPCEPRGRGQCPAPGLGGVAILRTPFRGNGLYIS
jgi:hypothetical protein